MKANEKVEAPAAGAGAGPAWGQSVPAQEGPWVEFPQLRGEVVKVTKYVWVKDESGQVFIVKKKLLPKELRRIGAVISVQGRISAVKSYLPNVDYMVYRITSEKYTPIPHRLVFDFTEQILRRAGLEYKKQFLTWKKRKGMFFATDRVELSFSSAKAGILVTNANTGEHAIHVTAFGFIEVCDNGAILSASPSAVTRIAHVGTVGEILRRLENAITNMVWRLPVLEGKWAVEVSRLAKMNHPPSVLDAWAQSWAKKMPEKYRKWWAREYERHLDKYGYTELALYQLLTYAATSLSNRNVKLAEAMEREAIRLLRRARR